MKYISSYKTSINFTPWFENSYRLDNLRIYEEIGGDIAHGTIEMSMDGSQKALDLMNSCYTGNLTIERDGGNIYNIDVFITNRFFYRNYVTLNFLCIKDGSFISDLIIQNHTDITGTIKKLYPGKQDIRCETDIQNTELKLYQNGITNASFLATLCKSFKRQSIFAFGWEGLLIKETIGKDSKGNEEPKLFFISNRDNQIDSYKESYSPELYNLPYNPWEDTESKHISKDFTENEPINIRAVTRYNKTIYLQTPYQILYENLSYNESYYNSNYFQSFRIIEKDIPKYKIGDVIYYKRIDQSGSNNTTWPYKTYLVKSNEFFCSTDNSNKVDSRGLKFSFLTKLVGLEKDGSIALGKDIDDDPTKTK